MKLVSVDKVNSYEESPENKDLTQTDRDNMDSAVEKTINGEVFISYNGEWLRAVRDSNGEEELISPSDTNMFLSEKLEMKDPHLYSADFMKAKR